MIIYFTLAATLRSGTITNHTHTQYNYATTMSNLRLPPPMVIEGSKAVNYEHSWAEYAAAEAQSKAAIPRNVSDGERRIQEFHDCQQSDNQQQYCR